MTTRAKVSISFLIIAYLYLLFYHLNHFPLFLGDEQVYTQSVTALLNGYIDKNNHPLLAKTIWYLVVYPAHAISGTDYPAFWRAGTIFTSIFTLMFFFQIARQIGASLKSSVFITMVLAIEPLYFTFSRLLQLEIPMMCFLLASAHTLLKSRPKPVLPGIFLGLAAACKFSAFLFLPAALYSVIAASKSKFKSAVIFLLAIFLGLILGNGIYFFKYHGHVPISAYLSDLYFSQINFNGATANASPPVSWFIHSQSLDLFHRQYLVTPNPLVIFTTIPIILISLLRLFLIRTQNKPVILFQLLGFLGQYLFWFFSPHATYLYYVLPIIPFSLLLLDIKNNYLIVIFLFFALSYFSSRLSHLPL